MCRTAVAYCLLTLAGLATAGEEDDSKVDGPVIGIDLGTTYSCVGIFKNGRVEIIANEQGNRIMPSYVAFAEEGRLVGEAAKNQATVNPTGTVFDVKRLIGRQFKDAAVQKDAKFFPFALTDRGGKPAISVKFKGEEKVLEPEEISAMVLSKLKETAETYLGQQVKHAVVTVPAYFNDGQRTATKDAGTIAGLNVLKVINEPTAAAIAFGLDEKKDQTILVYDLGGGTLDVSILRATSGSFEVVATSGNTRLGGEDFDQKVMQYIIKVFAKKHQKDLSGDKQAVQKLRVEVERAKRRLSSTHMAPLRIEALHEGIDLSESLSRATFEKINSELFQRTLEPLKQVLEDAKMQKSQIDEVVLVGGSTRIPKIQQLVREFFDGKEPARGINPDEAVASGAAIQGGMLGKEEGAPEATLVDVTPLTLGIETVGGIMTKVIARNTALPCKNSTVFTTFRDNQAALDIQVFEGERLMTKNNHALGTFQLSDIAPAPKGTPQIELTFNIDADGILSVEAEDKSSGKSEKITISNDKSRLSVEQIEEMIKDAEHFADEDLKMKECGNAKAAMETYLYSMKSMAEGVNDKDGLSEKMDAEEKQTILGAVMDGRDWLAGNPDAEMEEIQEKHKELEGQCGEIISKYLGAGAGSSDSDEEAPADEL